MAVSFAQQMSAARSRWPQQHTVPPATGCPLTSYNFNSPASFTEGAVRLLLARPAGDQVLWEQATCPNAAEIEVSTELVEGVSVITIIGPLQESDIKAFRDVAFPLDKANSFEQSLEINNQE